MKEYYASILSEKFLMEKAKTKGVKLLFLFIITTLFIGNDVIK